MCVCVQQCTILVVVDNGIGTEVLGLIWYFIAGTAFPHPRFFSEEMAVPKIVKERHSRAFPENQYRL